MSGITIKSSEPVVGDHLRPIMLDVSRLFSRLERGAPTGIDRVELAYAERLLALNSDAVFFSVVRKGRMRFAPRQRVGAAVACLRALWASGSAEGRVAAANLAAFLDWPELARDLPPDPDVPEARALGAVELRVQSRNARRALRAAGGATYLNVSHHHLEKRELLAAEKERLGLKIVVFWHDAAPIRFPEYVRPGDDAKHRRRLETVLALADGVIVNSQATADELRLVASGAAVPPIAVAPLWSDVDIRGDTAFPRKPPYFVCLGTIEPRKNHQLLLNLWRAMLAERGAQTPRLVLVGRRGWENHAAFAFLDRNAALKPYVCEAAELPDAALARLLAGARGLLFPSFAEGFGLPIVEAIEAGCPVVASDLPIFAEVGGACAHRIDPLDGPAWRDAIEDLAGSGSQLRARFEASRESFVAPTRGAHFRAACAFAGLARLGEPLAD